MFENLRNAFREAIDNFNKELSRDQVPETMDRLLVGMRKEMVDARARIAELEDQIARADADAKRQSTEADTARRREKLATDIGDAETAQVAGEYAERHEERRGVLEQKAAALRQELALLRREFEEMTAKMKEAEVSRAGLRASAGRTGARESLGAADDLFSELDRMAEKIGDEDARASAAEDFDDLDLESDMDHAPPPPPEMDVDERLRELKRRMGQE